MNINNAQRRLLRSEASAKAAEMYRAGRHPEDIAAELGVCLVTVYRHLYREGVRLVDPRQVRGEEKAKRALALLEGGMSVEGICLELGVARRTVYSLIGRGRAHAAQAMNLG